MKSERESVGRGVQCTIILIESGPHAQMHGCANLLICFCFLYLFFFSNFFFLVKWKANQRRPLNLFFGLESMWLENQLENVFFKELIWCVFLSQNMGPFRPHHISTLPTILVGKCFLPRAFL